MVAGAAIAAGIAIVNAGNDAKRAWDNTSKAITSASNSNDAVIRSLQNLSKTGTPEQQERAKITLKRLAETGAFAEGTNYAPGGMALVGERGPELVDLPRGSKVIPNHQLGGSVNVNVNVGMYAGTEMEKRRVAQSLFEALKDVAASKNTTVQGLMS